MTMEEKTMKTERVYEGKIINLRVDTVELPDKKYSKREIVEHSGAVGIIALTDSGNIVLVKQFRKPVEDSLLEIPAGKIEKDEEADACALRELEEETGYRTSNMQKLISFYTTPGFSNEVIHLYLALDLDKGIATPDEDEYIEVVELSIQDALEMIELGEIKDAKTIIGILTANQRFLKKANS
ncbi:NUDIX hydrolase [Alkaliphilus metalliredigens QYMF]|uniref:NUDIX hydrolase n=1 Tax=Alkaliphilus metalliredigens (strain QYMF) TaxID=293826 RepID=A6TR56_ALKMQ|nr:NUDIX hydrolase [Alkaliphilus metalliredigens]ABR48674.1 NUDIX hydrolase [Alkaliphilus metalliredigens QYMF]